jgi:hypothetical protein
MFNWVDSKGVIVSDGIAVALVLTFVFGEEVLLEWLSVEVPTDWCVLLMTEVEKQRLRLMMLVVSLRSVARLGNSCNNGRGI